MTTDNGIIYGNEKLADGFFLLASGLFVWAVVMRIRVKTAPIDILVAAGFAALSLGWLVL